MNYRPIERSNTIGMSILDVSLVGTRNMLCRIKEGRRGKERGRGVEGKRGQGNPGWGEEGGSGGKIEC